MRGIDAFKIYRSVKLHFTSDTYTIEKYGLLGSRIKNSSYENRRDKVFFEKAGKAFPDYKEFSEFLASNMVLNPDLWIGDLLGEDSFRNHHRFKRFTFAKKHFIISDYKYLIEQYETLKKSCETTEESDIVPIVQALLREEIYPETVCALDRLLRIFVYIDNTMGVNNPLWSTLRLRLEKYKTFITFKNSDEIEDIMTEINSLYNI